MQVTKYAKLPFGLALLLSIIFIIFYMTRTEAELPPMTVQEKKARFGALSIPAVNNGYTNFMTQYE